MIGLLARGRPNEAIARPNRVQRRARWPACTARGTRVSRKRHADSEEGHKVAAPGTDWVGMFVSAVVEQTPFCGDVLFIPVAMVGRLVCCDVRAKGGLLRAQGTRS